MIRCQGCDIGCTQQALNLVRDYGHVLYYCDQCADIYADFVNAMQAEEARRQREFDLWQEERRKDVPLILMPMDLPKRSQQSATPLVLG